MSSPPCFSSNGTFLPAYGSCSDSNGNDVCCAAGQTCLSNGLCVTDTAGLYSGGCTDKSYTSPMCPKFCVSGTEHFIVSCNGSNTHTGTSPASGEYCCSGDGSLHCCSDASSRLPLAAGSSTADAAFVIPVTLTAASSSGFVTTTLSPSSMSSQVLYNPTLIGIQSTSTPLPKTPGHQDFKGAGQIAGITLGLTFCGIAIVYGSLVFMTGKPDLGLRQWWAKRRARRHSTPRVTASNGHSTPRATASNGHCTSQASAPNDTATEAINVDRQAQVAVELEALKTAFERLNADGNRPAELPETSTTLPQQYPFSWSNDGAGDVDTREPPAILLLAPNDGNLHEAGESWEILAERWAAMGQRELDAAYLQRRAPRPNVSPDAVSAVREVRSRLATLRAVPYTNPILPHVTLVINRLYPVGAFPYLPTTDPGSVGGDTIAGSDHHSSPDSPAPTPNVVVTPPSDASPAISNSGAGNGQDNRETGAMKAWRGFLRFMFEPAARPLARDGVMSRSLLHGR